MYTFIYITISYLLLLYNVYCYFYYDVFFSVVHKISLNNVFKLIVYQSLVLFKSVVIFRPQVMLKNKNKFIFITGITL